MVLGPKYGILPKQQPQAPQPSPLQSQNLLQEVTDEPIIAKSQSTLKMRQQAMRKKHISKKGVKSIDPSTVVIDGIPMENITPTASRMLGKKTAVSRGVSLDINNIETVPMNTNLQTQTTDVKNENIIGNLIIQQLENLLGL